MNRPERIAVVLGTRPEIVKLAGVIRGLGDRAVIAFTGQHYDPDLSDSFFETFGLPVPTLRLTGIGGAARFEQVGQMVRALGEWLTVDPPAAVVVQGDTNTAAAGALAAHCAGVPLVHVEAGLRSYDRAMPEEINRMLIGVVADLHCAPTPAAANQLTSEGVQPSTIMMTGNTVVEAVTEIVPTPDQSAQVAAGFTVEPDAYVLATIHRPENTDDPRRLGALLDTFAKLPCPVVLPLHPRTRAAAEAAGLHNSLDLLRTCSPLDYRTFLAMARRARLLISDSGGVQEECTVLKRPLIVVRNSTERPEAIAAGFAVHVGPGPLGTYPDLLSAAETMLADSGLLGRLANQASPFGDGRASERIVAALAGLFLGAPDRWVGRGA